jgi:hypothetical protein
MTDIITPEPGASERELLDHHRKMLRLPKGALLGETLRAHSRKEIARITRKEASKNVGVVGRAALGEGKE